MMSTAGNVVPFSPAPVKPLTRGLFKFVSVPGLSMQAIQGLEATYPGTLTADMRSLLHTTCGLTAAEFGTSDFTGRWHPEEPISVFRPCLTLAIDDEGRRWIAETSRDRRLPGPVWCVLPDPAVTLHISDDLNGFLSTLNEAVERGHLDKWLRSLHRDARAIWEQAQATLNGLPFRVIVEHQDVGDVSNLLDRLERMRPDVVLIDISGWKESLEGLVSSIRAAAVRPDRGGRSSPTPARAPGPP